MVQLYCSDSHEEQLVHHEVPLASACELVQVSSSHMHGPSCGHEDILHSDHYDYLVRTVTNCLLFQ